MNFGSCNKHFHEYLIEIFACLSKKKQKQSLLLQQSAAAAAAAASRSRGTKNILTKKYMKTVRIHNLLTNLFHREAIVSFLAAIYDICIVMSLDDMKNSCEVTSDTLFISICKEM